MTYGTLTQSSSHSVVAMRSQFEFDSFNFSGRLFNRVTSALKLIFEESGDRIKARYCFLNAFAPLGWRLSLPVGQPDRHNTSIYHRNILLCRAGHGRQDNRPGHQKKLSVFLAIVEQPFDFARNGGLRHRNFSFPYVRQCPSDVQFGVPFNQRAPILYEEVEAGCSTLFTYLFLNSEGCPSSSAKGQARADDRAPEAKPRRSVDGNGNKPIAGDCHHRQTENHPDSDQRHHGKKLPEPLFFHAWTLPAHPPVVERAAA